MSLRPTIFVSAVSKELKSARQLVANTLTFLGYEPVWQDIFGTEQGDLREMLRRQIDECKGVVQLVGQRYGADPPTPDEHFGRVSYTQYEALYAQQQGKKVWYLVLDEDYPTDAQEPEPEELRELQSAYRRRLRTESRLRHSVGSRETLEVTVHKLRNELEILRTEQKRWVRSQKRWAAVVAFLLVLSVGIGVWLMKGQHTGERKNEQTRQEFMAVKTEVTELRDIAQYLLAESKARGAQPGQKPEEIEARTYEELAKIRGTDVKTERDKLQKSAKQVQNSAEATAYQRATAAYIVKNYIEAESLALRAAEDARKATPSRVADAIKAFELAGWSAEKQIRYTDALDHFRSAAALTDREREPIPWADVQDDIAYVLVSDRGQGLDAENILRDVVKVRERALGPEHLDTLQSRNSLATALAAQGKYPEAENEFRAVLAICERALGAEDSNTLENRNNLANALALQGKYAEAEKEARAALTIQERVLGPEHLGTLTSQMTVANALYFQRKFAEAEKENREALSIFERVLGPENPLTLKARNNLAETLRADGKNIEAERQLRATLEILERVLGPENPLTLMCRMNLATALYGQGQNVEAERIYRALVPIEERVQGPKHPDTLKARNNLAIVLLDQGKYGEAEEQFRAVLAMFADRFGPGNLYTLLTEVNLASALAAQNKFTQALELARTAEQRLRQLGEDQPEYKMAREVRQKIEAAQLKDNRPSSPRKQPEGGSTESGETLKLMEYNCAFDNWPSQGWNVQRDINVDSRSKFAVMAARPKDGASLGLMCQEYSVDVSFDGGEGERGFLDGLAESERELGIDVLEQKKMTVAGKTCIYVHGIEKSSGNDNNAWIFPVGKRVLWLLVVAPHIDHLENDPEILRIVRSFHFLQKESNP